MGIQFFMMQTNQFSGQVVFDLVIVGGGVNGCAIAAEAALKGLSVCLIEKNTLASATSGVSSNLIHGGLRYLEHYDFKLVKQSLREQIIWQKRAPHLVRPLPFILPYEKYLRPKWQLRVGLWLYDYLVFKKWLPKSKRIKRSQSDVFDPLQTQIKDGFCYYDCETQGSAITIANARLAQKLGATIMTQTSFESAHIDQNLWNISYVIRGQQTKMIQSKALVNATGPWVDVTNQAIHPNMPTISIQRIQGSHIIVPKLYDGHHAYILQNKDGRIVFALPFTDETTVIGTTDVPYQASLDTITIGEDEKAYLCRVANHYFEKSLLVSDILGHWSGVRTLIDQKTNDVSALSREHEILFKAFDQNPLITLVGGKLTNARLVAEETLEKLKAFTPWKNTHTTRTCPLPGGDLDFSSLMKLGQIIKQVYGFIPSEIIDRWILQWGSEISSILQPIQSINDLGQHFGHGLYAMEVDLLRQHFFAKTSEDILFRLTRLHAQFNQDQLDQLRHYLASTQE
jgi:glycerol-3-phosphate dehydrogenase